VPESNLQTIIISSSKGIYRNPHH